MNEGAGQRAWTDAFPRRGGNSPPRRFRVCERDDRGRSAPQRMAHQSAPCADEQRSRGNRCARGLQRQCERSEHRARMRGGEHHRHRRGTGATRYEARHQVIRASWSLRLLVRYASPRTLPLRDHPTLKLDRRGPPPAARPLPLSTPTRENPQCPGSSRRPEAMATMSPRILHHAAARMSARSPSRFPPRLPPARSEARTARSPRDTATGNTGGAALTSSRRLEVAVFSPPVSVRGCAGLLVRVHGEVVRIEPRQDVRVTRR